MAIVKIPKDCLITEDQDSITLNLPDNFLKVDSKSQEYQKIAQARGILKAKKQDVIHHCQKVRHEW
jgi:hypothetical protein